MTAAHQLNAVALISARRQLGATARLAEFALIESLDGLDGFIALTEVAVGLIDFAAADLEVDPDDWWTRSACSLALELGARIEGGDQ